MVELTKRERTDLCHCVEAWMRTRGSIEWPDGQPIPLHTGQALKLKGMVRRAVGRNPRQPMYLPTQRGITLYHDLRKVRL